MKNEAKKGVKAPRAKRAKRTAAQAANASNTKFCVEPECKETATLRGYCRLHYLSNWKHIKFNQKVKAERRLNAYVDRLAKKYPADFMERIKEGLEDENKFRQTVQELDVETEETPETDNEFLEKFMRIVKPE